MIGSLVVSSLIGMAAHFGEPVSTADSFTMPVKQGIILLVKGKRSITENGEVMIFAPGLTGDSLDRDLAEGPVKHIRVRELPRGLAVVLTPSGTIDPASIVMSEGKIKVAGQAMRAPQVAPTSITPALAATRESVKAGDVRGEIADTAAVAKPIAAPATAPVAAKPLAFKEEPASSPMRNLLVMAALIGAAAIAVVMGKKRKTQARHGVSAGIDLIAVRSLGPKQRLAVVEAGGDRLLIASTENGVQLLSRLTGSQAFGGDAFENVLAEAERSEPVPAPTKGNRRSADVAGLVKLRAARSTWSFDQAGD